MGNVRVTFYGALAKITEEKDTQVKASSIREAISALTVKYGEQFSNRVYGEERKLRRFVNIYVNGKDISFLDHLDTELNDEDKVSIIPAVGGG